MNDSFPTRLASLKSALAANQKERKALLPKKGGVQILEVIGYSKNIAEARVIVRQMALLNEEMLVAKEAEDRQRQTTIAKGI